MTIPYEGMADAMAHHIPLTMENASGFVSTMLEFIEKAGLKGKVHISYIPSPLPNAGYGRAGSTHVFSFTEGLFQLFQNHDLHSAPTAEMQAVMAHEVSHGRHFLIEQLPPIVLPVALPIAGLGAMYLIDKTNEKLRARKELSPEKPQAFWDAFKETLQDTYNAGLIKTFNDFTSRANPLTNKLFDTSAQRDAHKRHEQLLSGVSSETPLYPHQQMSWAKAALEEAKYMAVAAAMAIPAMAACRKLNMVREFRADRFSAALTGNKDMVSALQKLSVFTEEAVTAQAQTALEKNWAKRVSKAVWEYVSEALNGTHPPNSSRIKALENLNITDAARQFGL